MKMGNKFWIRHLAAVLIIALFTLTACGSSNTSSEWSFAVLCDSRSSYSTDNLPSYYNDNGTSPYFTNVANALAKEKNIDFVLFPGDLIRGKKPTLTGAQMVSDFTQWNAYMKPVYDAGIPVYYIRGNHDASEVSDPSGSGGNATNIWRQFLTTVPAVPDTVTQDSSASQNKLTYSFMHKGSLFVGLDEYVSDSSMPLGYDQSFLKTQLANQADHKFVFMHQPVWNNDTTQLANNASTLASDLNSANVDVYFSGHVHSYQRITKTGYSFEEMILGTAGAPQDNPLQQPNDTTNAGAQNLTLQAYNGGSGSNALFGYAIITVHSDGTVTSVVKFLSDPTNPNSSLIPFDAATVSKR